jgi:hypothetical protein
MGQPLLCYWKPFVENGCFSEEVWNREAAAVN